MKKFSTQLSALVSQIPTITSTGVQNPSLTYMALTARAADYAARLVKEGR